MPIPEHVKAELKAFADKSDEELLWLSLQTSPTGEDPAASRSKYAAIILARRQSLSALISHRIDKITLIVAMATLIATIVMSH